MAEQDAIVAELKEVDDARRAYTRLKHWAHGAGAARDRDDSDDELVANTNHATWRPQFASSDEDDAIGSEEGSVESADADAVEDPANGEDANEALTTALESARVA